MVSFFGLKVGGKKKKPDGKAQDKQAHQWKRVDQNAMGEGQFFGQNINQKGVVNGSIRSVSRNGAPGATDRSPYHNYDTHNLAAASMFDLGNADRPQSQISLRVKPHASDINLRGRFGANNGSSTSLAVPAPGFGARFGANNGSSTSLAAPTPGFGARFGANNGSSTSLAAPGPGFGSRPGTPSKANWVNPLDVHFMRSVPSGPPTPKSPLGGSMQLPPTPTTDQHAETGSIFGEDADDMVQSVMASVKKREEEAQAAKKREQELEKQRETARLDMERLERQKSTESNLSGRRPSAPQIPLPEAFEKSSSPEPALPAPIFRGDFDARPGSRNGPKRPPQLHQGPPPSGPPTQCLPQPPGQGPPRQAPLGSGSPGPIARPLQAPYSPPGAPQRSVSAQQDVSQKVFRPYRPPPLQGSGPLGPLPDGLRSPSPPLSTPGVEEFRQSPAFRSPPRNEHRPGMFHREPEPFSSNGRGIASPERRGTEPLISTLASPSTVTSPAGSIRRMSLDDEPIEQFARPIIQNVRGLRDTLTLNTPRRHSLSMRIEEFEKTLVNAQKAQAQQARRGSRSSSVYSGGHPHDDDEDEDDGPILSIQPAPLRVPLPMAPPPPTTAAAINRPQSPMRGPPRRGPLPRRPALEEYGVSSAQVSLRNRGGTPTPASRSGSTDNYSAHSSSPASRTDTPQLRHPNWKRELNQPSPAPTLDAFERPRPSPVVDAFERPRPSPVVDTFDRPRPSPVVETFDRARPAPAPAIDTGFNFDFGPTPNIGFAPPTPDSSTWSLASPTLGSDIPPPTIATTTGAPPPPAITPSLSRPTPSPSPNPSKQQPHQQQQKFTRSHVPPPLNLKFNFSADAPSRDPTLGLWTPPIRPAAPFASSSAAADGRPSTSSGPAPAPTDSSTSSSSGTTTTTKASGGGNKQNTLAASPSLISQFPESAAVAAGGDDHRSSWMGIGMARGPSIRDVRRPKTAGGKGHAPPGAFGMGFGNGAGSGSGNGNGNGGKGHAPVDSFGTGFI